MNSPASHGAVKRGALPVPLYEYVKRDISESIMTGILVQGAVPPSAAALAAQYSTAVGTIRRALADLAVEGRLSRRRKTGTVVTGRAPQHSLRLFFHYVRLHAASRGLVRSEPKTMALRRASATAGDAAGLALEPGSELVEIGRLRGVGGQPIMRETILLSAGRLLGFPDMPEQAPDLLYLHLLNICGTRVIAVREELSAALASAEERTALLLPRPIAVLRIRSTTFDQTVEPVLLGRYAAHTAEFVYVNEIYSVHARIRKSLGEMTRKLSDTASQ